MMRKIGTFLGLFFSFAFLSHCGQDSTYIPPIFGFEIQSSNPAFQATYVSQQQPMFIYFTSKVNESSIATSLKVTSSSGTSVTDITNLVSYSTLDGGATVQVSPPTTGWPKPNAIRITFTGLLSSSNQTYSGYALFSTDSSLLFSDNNINQKSGEAPYLVSYQAYQIGNSVEFHLTFSEDIRYLDLKASYDRLNVGAEVYYSPILARDPSGLLNQFIVSMVFMGIQTDYKIQLLNTTRDYEDLSIDCSKGKKCEPHEYINF